MNYDVGDIVKVIVYKPSLIGLYYAGTVIFKEGSRGYKFKYKIC